MRYFFSFRRATGWLAAATLSFSVSGHAQPSDSAMHTALEAARNQQWERIDTAAISGHVLEGYVEYHRLRSRLPLVEPGQVLDFIERHQDSPLGEWLRGQAIAQYGDAGRYDYLLAVADGEPSGTARQCHYYTALYHQDPEAAAAGGRTLWHVGHSQPTACDTLFDRLRASGEISEVDIWGRKMLAWQQGETGLANYLSRLLSNRWQTGIDAVEQLQHRYADITRIPTCIGPECLGSGPLFVAAMHGFIRADTEAAMEAWRKIAPHLPIEQHHLHSIEEELAFYSLVRGVEHNLGWVDDTLPRIATSRVIELRIRHALTQRDWHGVLHWFEYFAPEDQEESRWQYWKARAHEQLGDSERADVAYALAAQGRNFFGFAAADRIGRSYSLNLERAQIDPALHNEVAQWPVVQRTEALLRLGEEGLANSEWLHAAANGSPQQVRALADYAQRRGWHARLVQTTISAQLWDALDWRFPQAYREHFIHWGQQTGVDPYLLMGIARRESAYNPVALSPAGARGLMQIMPGTATLLSRQLGISDPGPYGVLDPELNIRLGSTYIRDMTERYRGNRLAAAAAYNAGPGRVDRWLQQAPEEFDLFVESIPFRETRNYVQAVLTYRVIFESLANDGSSEGVTMLSQTEKTVSYDGSLLARR